MSSHYNQPTKLDFVSECLPGSLAEQKEKERMAEFQRSKAMRQEEEERSKEELKAKRDKKYLADCEANKARKYKNATVYPLRNNP